MLVARKFNTYDQLLELLRGADIARGTQGTNTASNATLQDGSGNGGFAGVAVGDTVHISGEASSFTVQSVTDDNEIVMTTNITAPHTANAEYRIFRGGIDLTDIKVGPIADPLQAGGGLIIYEKLDFGV